ncbi:MAG: DsbA family protein [bacterium]|nr:DsbA family protein [bacterium]
MKFRAIWVVLVLISVVGTTLPVAAEEAQAPAQDPVILRFAERALPFYPGSSFKIKADERQRGPSGSYRIITIDRDCNNDFLRGSTVLVVDEVSNLVFLGAAGQLPAPQDSSLSLHQYIEGFLPKALEGGMGIRVRVNWDSGGFPSGALIPFTLLVESGYGDYRKPAALSSDGRFIVLGPPFPLNEDPVALRRKLLSNHPAVVRSHGRDKAAVEIVEFSDFECPGCKNKWPLIKEIIEEYDDRASHAAVAFPLTRIHPWAFRSASAAWCISREDVTMLTNLKELFYSLQGEMKTDMVRATALDFVSGQGMDEAGFGSCFLGSDSIAGVLEQMSLGHRLGVNATPTYFVNGWQVQVPKEEWFPTMVRRLSAGIEP